MIAGTPASFTTRTADVFAIGSEVTGTEIAEAVVVVVLVVTTFVALTLTVALMFAGSAVGVVVVERA